MLFVALDSGAFFAPFFVVAVIFALGLAFQRLHEPRQFYHNKVLQRTPITRTQFMNMQRLLEERMSYFRALDIKGRARFMNRLVEVMQTKLFRGMEGLEVTGEMKVLISAGMAQITYGLNAAALSHIKVFHIYPREFFSRLMRLHLKGGTSTSGVVMLSWDDFKKGYANDNDARNLGLHEMAHGLKLSLFFGNEVDRHFARYLDLWLEVGKPAFEMVRSGKNGFLRDYAGRNMHEFFAVCVEHFFEVPDEFKKRLPKVYEHLCLLLNQDPLRVHDNYLLPAGLPVKLEKDREILRVPENAEKKYYGSMHWTMKVILAGVFMAAPAMIVAYPATAISTQEIWVAVAGLAVVAYASHFKTLMKQNYIPSSFFILFVIFGFMPVGLGGGLLLNYLTTGVTAPQKETWPIAYWEHVPGGLVIHLKDGPPQYHRQIRTLDHPSFEPPLEANRYLALYFSRGILGLKVLEEAKLVKEE